MKICLPRSCSVVVFINDALKNFVRQIPFSEEEFLDSTVLLCKDRDHSDAR